jgi:hypothetical protein
MSRRSIPVSPSVLPHVGHRYRAEPIPAGYPCQGCGDQYRSLSLAEACEARHVKPALIVDATDQAVAEAEAQATDPFPECDRGPGCDCPECDNRREAELSHREAERSHAEPEAVLRDVLEAVGATTPGEVPFVVAQLRGERDHLAARVKALEAENGLLRAERTP